MEKMATNKSHNKSPVFKMGQMWHTIDDCTAADEDDPEEEDVIKDNETMKLRREDMSLFGICPAWDQFYLVVCEYCQQVIKPQALQKHIELRHSYHKNNSNNQMNHSSKVRTDSTNTTTNTPSIRRSSSTTTATTATKITENGSDINDIENDIKSEIFANNVAETDVKLESCSADVQTSPDYVNDSTPSESVTTIDTSCVKSEFSETEDMTSKLTSKLIDILSPINSTTVPLLPEPTGPGPGPGFATIVSADSESVTISVPDVELSPNSSIVKDPVVPTVPIVSKPAPKKKSYKKSTNPRKLLPCKDREYDANKHCGVCLPDMERPCTRSLTCKTHSLTLRRAVQGRIKNFDELLSEHREAKEAALRAQGIEVKPTKKAIQKQQQQLKASQQLQLKEEQNQQLMSDKSISSQPLIPISRTLVLSESQTQTMVSNINTNSNSLLSFVSSPVISHSDSVVVREPVSVAPRSQLRLDQIEVDSDGSMWMRCHPRPASVCNFNVRTLNGSRLVSRNNDLTLAALRSTFNSPMLVSKLTNNQKCSSTHTLSPIAIKSPLRNSNQTFIANKKLCVSLDSESVESSSDSGIDPYNFADGLTNSNNFTYVKPKTTVSKSTTYTSKKKKKSDINCSTYNSSLLSNGQIFHTTNAKTIGSNPKKKSVLKKNCNISQISSIGNTIAVSDSPLMASDSTTVSTNCEPLLNPSTSLSGQVPQRNLNDILSNSIDSNRSDNVSILLNGSLLSCKRNTLNALSKQTNSDIKDSFSPKTISPAKSPNSNNINNNRFLLNSPPLTTITSGLSINANSRPLLQRQILPSNTINSNLNSSQNVSQISQSLQNTTHAIFIKSAKQSLQNQFIPITSPQLLSKTEDYTS